MTTLRRALLATLLLAALVAVVAVLRAPAWTAEIIERRVGAALAREVRVQSVRLALFPLRAEIRGLTIAGRGPADPPFLEVPLVVAVTSVRPLWEKRLDLYELRVSGPKIRIHAYREGGDDIPKLRPRGGSGEVRLRRLVVEGGEVWVDHQRVPVDLDLPDVHGRFTPGKDGRLGGRLAFGPGAARFGKSPALVLSTFADVILGDGALIVEHGRLQAPRTDLAYRGRVDLVPKIRATFDVTGAVDLAVADHHVLRTGFRLEGPARYHGTVQIEGSKVRIRGRLTGEQGVFDGVPVPRYAGDVAWSELGVQIRGLETTLLGGTAVFDIDVPPRPGEASLRALLRGIDAEAATAYLFDIGRPGIASAATGQVDIRWPRGRIRALTGQMALDLAALADQRTPLHGRFVWRAKDGHQTVEQADLQTPTTGARLSGTVDLSDTADLAVVASASDIAEADRLGLRLRRALGAADAEAFDVGGRTGSFEGRWRGTLRAPVFEGRFAGGEVHYLGIPWGRAEWVGTSAGRELRFDTLVVRRPGAELVVRGRMDPGGYGTGDAVDLRLHLLNWPAHDLVSALAWDLDLTGDVSGEVEVKGRRSVPIGSARLSSSAGRYYGVPYQDLRVRSAFRDGRTEVAEGRVTVAGGTAAFHGTATAEGVYDGEARVENVDAALLAATLEMPARVGATLSGRVVLGGSLERPRLDASLQAPVLAVVAVPIGPLDARLVGSGDGTVGISATISSARADVTLAGSASLAAPHVASLDLAMATTPLDGLLRAAGFPLPDTVAVRGAGRAHVQGPLGRAHELAGEAEITTLEIALPDYPISNLGPARVALREGRLDVRSLHLAGEGTSLAVEGSVGLRQGAAVDASVRGAADLRALSFVWSDLRGQGAARVSAAVAGTRAAPRVAGSLDLDGVAVRMRGFPHGIEGVRGRVDFDQRSATFAGLTGTLGGGTVELGGQALYTGARVTSFDVQGTGRGVSLRYPEGLRSTVDADLRFFGDEARQWLTGTVDVRQALWTRRYDVASELLAVTTLAPAAETSLGGGVRYDVKVRAPGTLKIDNNLTTLQARADLTLQGTYAAPVVLGRAEIDRGRVYFQGNTYVIRRGTIDFANPQRIDPLFDIEAETRVRSYTVTLRANGTLERVSPTLSSDPPLTTVGILSLLAGADDPESLTGTADRTPLAATGAASLAAGRLSEEFGLERGASRLGLSRFSIDPAVVRGEYRNPTVRLTAGKRITPDLSVVYSQDLRGTEEHLLSIEYSLSDQVSLLLTRAEPGGVGFDLRLRRTQ